MSALIPFAFNEIRLKEACWLDGKPYFTRRAIGEWLEYANPIQSITKIIERNPHVKPFSTVVKMTTVEGVRNILREVDAFDPIGLQLIINKSNQPRALAFQIAVAHLVVAYMKGELHCPPLSLAMLAQEKPRARGFGQKLLDVARTEAHFKNVKGQIGVTPGTVRYRIQRIRDGKPVNGSAAGLLRFTWKRHRDQIQTVLELWRQGFKVYEIAAKTGVSRSTAHRWRTKKFN